MLRETIQSVEFIEAGRYNAMMLRFDTYKSDLPHGEFDLGGGYCFGYDQTPLRADLAAEANQISCQPGSDAPMGLSVLWDLPSSRQLMGTTRLGLGSAEAYNLPLELARGAVHRLYSKAQEWGLLEFPDAATLMEKVRQVHLQFIEALKVSVVDQTRAAELADMLLQETVDVGEAMATYHAEMLLSRNSQADPLKIGIGVGPRDDLVLSGPRVEGMDLLRVHMPWRRIELTAGSADYKGLDGWVQYATRKKIPIHAGPLLCFQTWSFPGWVRRLGDDFDALRQLMLTHVQRTVTRYAGKVSAWTLASGLNAFNPMGLTFEQLTDLIKAASHIVRKADPEAEIHLELAWPWGEYLTARDRVIPPMLFADWATHSDVPFDAFSIQIYQGFAKSGAYVRDMFQISSLLDDLLPHDRPVHVIVQSPSSDQDDALSMHSRSEILAAGTWRGDWTPTLQGQWLSTLGKIVASKPAIASLTWRDIADAPDVEIPHGGLCRNNLTPKPAYQSLLDIRKTRSAKT